MPDQQPLDELIARLARAGFGAGHTFSAAECDDLDLPPSTVGQTVRETVEAMKYSTAVGFAAAVEQYATHLANAAPECLIERTDGRSRRLMALLAIVGDVIGASDAMRRGEETAREDFYAAWRSLCDLWSMTPSPAETADAQAYLDAGITRLTEPPGEAPTTDLPAAGDGTGDVGGRG